MRAQSNRCKLLDRHHTERLQRQALCHSPVLMVLMRSLQTTAHGNCACSCMADVLHGIYSQADRSLIFTFTFTEVIISAGSAVRTCPC